jgi:hypothetical protein
MKELLVLFLACVLTFQYPSLSWATSPSPQAQAVIELIETGLEQNYQQILVQSISLSTADRDYILSLKKKDPLVPFLLNFVPGLGLGSFLQGNVEGGLIQTTGEAVGLIIFLGGMIGAVSNSGPLPQQSNDTIYLSINHESVPFYAIQALLGLTLVIGFKSYGLVIPFYFSNIYNEKLKTALAGESLSWQPFVSENGIGIRLAF